MVVLTWLPHSTWADGNLAQVDGQLGMMIAMDHSNQIKVNPTRVHELLRHPVDWIWGFVVVILKEFHYSFRHLLPTVRFYRQRRPCPADGLSVKDSSSSSSVLLSPDP